MSDRKISALTDGSPAQLADLFPIARAGANYRLPLSALEWVVNVRRYGALGNGSTDDQAAFVAAIAATPAGGTLYIPAGTYRLGGGFIINKAMRIIGDGPASRLKMDGTTTSAALFWIGGGVQNGTFNPGYAGTVYDMGTAALAAGQVTYTFASVSGLAVGDVLFLALGIDPYDGGQHFLRQWNVVGVINGNQVTMRTPLPEAVGSVPAPQFQGSPTFHEAAKFTSRADGIVISDLAIEHVPGPAYEPAVFLIRARNALVSNLYFPDVYSGIVIAEVENATVTNIVADRVRGAGFVSMYGSENVAVQHCAGSAIKGPGFYLENQCRVFSIEDSSLSGDEAEKTATAYITIGGGCLNGNLRNVRLTATAGQPNAHALIVENDSQIRTENIELLAFTQFFRLKYHSGLLRYKGVVYRDQKVFRVKVPLTDNMSGVSYKLPNGLMCRAKVRVSSKTGLFVVRFISSAGNLDAFNGPGVQDYFPAAGVFGEFTNDYLVSLGEAAEFVFNASPTGHSVDVWTQTVTPGAVIQMEFVFLVPEDDGVNGSDGFAW